MNRRRFLSFSALSISVSGCIAGTPGGETETDSPTSNPTETPGNTATETERPSPDGETPECWPSMCEGTTLVEVVVNADFSGSVVLEADCRGEDVPIQPGESVEIVRTEDAESCGITLFVADEQAYSDDIEGYESVTLTVRSNGDVDEEFVVV